MNSKLKEIFKNKTWDSCYIIAEIGSNFNGNLDLARQSIDAAKQAGADAVKFQTFKADEFVADKDLMYTYTTIDGKSVTESQYEMFKRLELRDEWHQVLKDYAESLNVDFLSSAADKEAVDLLVSLNVPAIKLASEDLINVRLLEYIARLNYPVILSTGMANETEISNALNIFEKQGSTGIIILHCVSVYPTPFENAGLNRIKALKENFSYPVGYSDHTEGWLAPVLSVGLGSCIIEKHFTLDKSLPGPDHKFASDVAEFTEMVNMVRTAEKMLGQETLMHSELEETSRNEYRRSIVASGFIGKGSMITEEMLAYKRPGYGLKPYERDMILGKIAKKDFQENDPILSGDVN